MHGKRNYTDIEVNNISLYAALREFEADMKEHTILGDDVVFPRDIALERAAGSYATAAHKRAQLKL